VGIKQAPCPHTLVNWGTSLSMVRIQSARRLQGGSWRLAPFPHGCLWMIDISIGLGPGKILRVLARNAPHHQRVAAAPGLPQVQGMAVSVAASWTGETIAALLQRVMVVRGRPAADLKDCGSARHQAIGLLEAQGRARPSLAARSHAVANRLKRRYQEPPPCATVVSACGRVSGQRTHTMLACLAPPPVHTKARLRHVPRLVTWADRLLKRSPAGGATGGSTLEQWRACLDAFPTCQALITQLRDDAVALLACQKRLTTQGLSHDPLAQCEPLIDALPSVSVRREWTGSLPYQLQTATTLGLDHVGLPISSDPIASLCGVAKQHGVGESKEAGRMALRLPAFCGVPTREEARQVLDVSVATPKAITAPCPSLTQQRRKVLPHPNARESVGTDQASIHVERIPSPKNRPNSRETSSVSKSSTEAYGQEMHGQDDYRLPESAVA